MRAKLTALLCVIFVLTGCKSNHKPLNSAIALRNQIADSGGCCFHAKITADYGEKIYTFSMDCQTDRDGNLIFTVTEPETIAGITGKINASGGAITFDDQVLAFQTMADGLVTPVTAPWLFMNTLRSGYLKGCTEVEDGLEISIDDSYAEYALHLRVITKDKVPASAEIFWQGRRILTLAVENFVFM